MTTKNRALTLWGPPIVKVTGQAKYLLAADRIRSVIDRHDLTHLPAARELEEALGVSQRTLIEALKVLKREGRIATSQGIQTQVVKRLPIRRLEQSRYREEMELLKSGRQHPLESGFTRENGIPWESFDPGVSFEWRGARRDEADRLGISVGAKVLARHFVKSDGERPLQLQDSVIPASLVRGTPVADADKQPWPGGTLAELYSLGLVVNGAEEVEDVRPATLAEQRELGIGEVSVRDITRTFYVDDRPVETSRVIVEASRYTLVYRTAF